MRPEDQDSGQGRYAVVPRTLVFVSRETPAGREELLLIRGAPDKRLWAGKYNGIGGHLEAGESPAASARRELREETGLDVEQLDLRAIVHITLPESPGIILFVFIGTGPSGKLTASAEGLPVWVDREGWSTLPLVEDLPQLLPRLLAAHAERSMIYGVYHVTDAGLRMAFD
ncbi:MAG: 8-oxo-dGTP diphosphatase [Anaerolineae bacterium]|nr:8-oxo-dGTP diphosphatase [Anaerolineae bacterium]